MQHLRYSRQQTPSPTPQRRRSKPRHLLRPPLPRLLCVPYLRILPELLPAYEHEVFRFFISGVKKGRERITYSNQRRLLLLFFLFDCPELRHRVRDSEEFAKVGDTYRCSGLIL